VHTVYNDEKIKHGISKTDNEPPQRSVFSTAVVTVEIVHLAYRRIGTACSARAMVM